MAEIEKEKIALPNNWRKSDYLKFMYSGKWKMSKAINCLKKHLEWRNNPLMHNLTDANI
jgi:hypothetical protein